MPRTSRQHSDTGVYHVMLRGIDRRDIFADDQDRSKFLKILRAVTSPEDHEGKPLPPLCHIHAYCLMDNHVHLLIAEAAEDIGTVMKRIGVSYVSYYNKRHERLGPLFHDRFRSEPVGDTGYFITLLRYIHQNPVQAEMVTSPGQYSVEQLARIHVHAARTAHLRPQTALRITAVARAVQNGVQRQRRPHRATLPDRAGPHDRQRGP